MSDFNTPFGAAGYILFWGLFTTAFGLFLYRVVTLIRILRMGRRQPGTPGKPFSIIGKVFLQICSLNTIKRGDLAGIGHALLFWGFGLFFIGYIWSLGLGAGLGLWGHIESNPAWAGYASILDIAGIVVTLAVIWAAIRRFIIRPARLKPTAGTGIILGMVFSLMILHFLSRGFGYANEYQAGVYPPVQAAAGRLFAGLPESAIQTGYTVTWWLHYGLILAFLVYVPYSKHLHILTSPANAVSRGGDDKGSLTVPDLNQVEGTNSISNISRSQILDLFSCAECGRCHEVCPTVISGKNLSPREQVLNLKNHVIKTGTGILKNREQDIPLNLAAAAGDEIWECVTCRACEEVCPVDIRHVERMVDLRRASVLMEGKFPGKLRQFYRNIEENNNPWGKAWMYRANWSEGLNLRNPKDEPPSDTIYWSGCLGAYDERIQRISMAVVRLLAASGTQFTILGKKEQCCGDAVRRTGNEFLYQQMARQNIETFKKSGVKRIITNCPHCYHVFKTEYPQLGGNYEVIHHTQLLAGLISQGKIKMAEKPPQKSVLYHDPCYLGRYNGVFTEPRQILQSIPGLKILEKNPCGKEALCCGAGGGGMWMHETGKKRISQVLLGQAAEHHPDILATACPYCLTTLENEARESGMENSTAVMDIIELYQSSLS